MFKTPFRIALLLLTASALFLLFRLQRNKEREEAVVATLFKAPEKSRGLTYSENVRQEVVKEIWFQEKETHQVRIQSKESALFFFQEGKAIEVVEQLGEVDCLMQEKLFTYLGKPMQEVRALKAKRACYNYTTQLFVAEDVFLSKFHLEGHLLPESIDPNTPPLMEGVAEGVEFVLTGDKIDFKAHAFEATFDTVKRGL